MLLKGCLNGARSRSEHPGCPIEPDELARDARAVVAEGVAAIHVHPRDEHGNETMTGGRLNAALSAIRETVSVPIGVSTGAWFLPDARDRLRAIEHWEALPDFASVNFHEEGAGAIARLLLDRGIGVEAGLWHHQAAVVLLDSGLAESCIRLLLEPTEQTVDAALENVTAIERRIKEVAPEVPRLLHGVDSTTWPLLSEAARRGYQGRIGFEDTLERPDGELARSNRELARIAADLVGSPSQRH